VTIPTSTRSALAGRKFHVFEDSRHLIMIIRSERSRSAGACTSSWGAIDDADNAAWAAPGVTEVDDQLHIQT
jgi:hypothetical protein